MNAGATAERAYEALKRRVRDGGLRPGERLDPSVLADELSTSVTPVRDALHRLTGERLVETRTSDGFHIPAASEPAVQDLYDWSAQILLLALRAGRGAVRADDPNARLVNDGATAADRTEALFASIAARSANAEHTEAMQSINDRLHRCRLVEPQLLDGMSDELDTLITLAGKNDAAALRKALTAYHRRRRRIASELVRLLYRHD